MKKSIFLTLTLVLISVAAQQAAVGAPAQTQPAAKFAPGTAIPAELSKSMDAKKVKVGDPVEAKTSVDMLSNGQIILPRNTKVMGHIASAKAHSKDSPDSTLGIAFDKLVMKDGQEMPLQLSIQAIGAPINTFASGSPTSNGSDVAPAGPIGSTPGGGSMGGGGRTANGASSQPTNPTGGRYGGMDGSSHGSALSASSQGVVGMKDLSLSATTEASVISSSKKNVHLDSGSQLILKVQ